MVVTEFKMSDGDILTIEAEDREIHTVPTKQLINMCTQPTYMQFLAARSRCTNLFSARYSIPFAMSRHILINTSLGIF